MRKIIWLAGIFLILTLIMTGCQPPAGGTDTPTDPPQASTPTPNVTDPPTVAPTEAPTAAPTAAPTEPPTEPPTPTPEPTIGPGSVFLSPVSLSATAGSTCVTEVHVDTGTEVVAAYGISLLYDNSIIQITDDAQVAAGADGFLTAANPLAGECVISGFDINGKGPSTDLHLLTVTWNAVAAGTSAVTVEVDNLTNASYADIGTLQGFGCSITVSE